MNLKNWLTLTVQAVDFNLVANRPDFLAKLRTLTLAPHSGLNHELTHLSERAQKRPVNCKLLLAYRFRDLVAWAILSKEDSSFVFSDDQIGFRREDGWMFQVFVTPKHRRQGIASELLRKAKKLVQDDTLCVSPWDERSYKFYDKFLDIRQKRL